LRLQDNKPKQKEILLHLDLNKINKTDPIAADPIVIILLTSVAFQVPSLSLMFIVMITIF